MAPSCGNLTANQTAMVIVGAAAGVAIGALAHSAEASASTITGLGSMKHAPNPMSGESPNPHERCAGRFCGRLGSGTRLGCLCERG